MFNKKMKLTKMILFTTIACTSTSSLLFACKANNDIQRINWHINQNKVFSSLNKISRTKDVIYKQEQMEEIDSLFNSEIHYNFFEFFSKICKTLNIQNFIPNKDLEYDIDFSTLNKYRMGGIWVYNTPIINFIYQGEKYTIKSFQIKFWDRDFSNAFNDLSDTYLQNLETLKINKLEWIDKAISEISREKNSTEGWNELIDQELPKIKDFIEKGVIKSHAEFIKNDNVIDSIFDDEFSNFIEHIQEIFSKSWYIKEDWSTYNDYNPNVSKLYKELEDKWSKDTSLKVETHGKLLHTIDYFNLAYTSSGLSINLPVENTPTNNLLKSIIELYPSIEENQEEGLEGFDGWDKKFNENIDSLKETSSSDIKPIEYFAHNCLLNIQKNIYEQYYQKYESLKENRSQEIQLTHQEATEFRNKLKEIVNKEFTIANILDLYIKYLGLSSDYSLHDEQNISYSNRFTNFYDHTSSTGGKDNGGKGNGGKDNGGKGNNQEIDGKIVSPTSSTTPINSNFESFNAFGRDQSLNDNGGEIVVPSMIFHYLLGLSTFVKPTTQLKGITIPSVTIKYTSKAITN